MTPEHYAEAMAVVIRSRMHAAGLTTRQMGVSHGTIVQLGGTASREPRLPSLSSLLCISRTLGMRPSELLAEAEAVADMDGDGGAR